MFSPLMTVANSNKLFQGKNYNCTFYSDLHFLWYYIVPGMRLERQRDAIRSADRGSEVLSTDCMQLCLKSRQ